MIDAARIDRERKGISVLEDRPAMVVDCPVMKIDLRSVLVGLLFGIVIAFGIAANGKDEPQVGRFQIVAGHNSDSNYHVVDTATGQVWRNDRNPKLK
ncbi:MAG: hypothetical protein AAF591_23700 [Verrucomicrobiota bacterium]